MNVLGCILLERDTLDKSRQNGLVPGDFSRSQNADICAAAYALADKNEPIELLSVQQYMEARGTLPGGGGLSYLMSLFDTVSSTANAPFWMDKVKDAARLRRKWENNHRQIEAIEKGVADVDAFFKQAQTDDERIQQAQPGPIVQARRKPLAERIISLRNVPDPPVELPYLFGPYLVIGDAHVLTGPTGIGKSTFLYNVLPALAEGRELWGIPCKPVKVLYVDMENGAIGRSMKAQKLFRDRAEREGLDNLLFLCEHLKMPEEQQDLLAYVQAEQVQFVVFDTLRRCFPVRDENDNAEVHNRIIPVLDALKTAGVASLLITHPSKAGNGGARGAGALEGAVDSNLSLTMHGGADVNDPNGIVSLSVAKGRLFGMTTQPLLLRRVGEDGFERIDAGEAGPAAKSSLRDRCHAVVIDALAGAEGLTARHGDLWKAAQDAGFGKPTFDRALREMKERGDIHCPERGVYVLDDPFADEADG